MSDPKSARSSRPVLRDLDLGNDWLYAWGDLPTNLDDLRQWLKDNGISEAAFKNSAQYEANYERFPWLKGLSPQRRRGGRSATDGDGTDAAPRRRQPH